MFKLVVVLSLAVLAAANPGALVPAVHSTIVPGVRSISAYDTSIVHPSPIYTVPIVHAAPLAYGTTLYGRHGYHHLGKRSLGLAPVSYSSIVSPGAYYNNWAGYGYGAHYAPWGAWNRHGLAYSNAIVHPY